MSADLTLYASVVSAAAAVILVVFGLPPFLRWLRERKRPLMPPPIGAHSSPSAVHVHFWDSPPAPRDAAPNLEQVRSTHPAPNASEANSARIVSKLPFTPTPPRTRVPPKPKEVVLFNETLEVEATGSTEVHERLSKGTIVDGMVEEVSGQPLDFYIMEQRNYARFSEDRSGTDIYAQEDRVAFNFRRKIPRDGVWYFVFDAYGKQADRAVRFELRATEPD